MADLKRLSKFVSVMLRHDPDNFQLELDEQGFTDLEAVWQRIQGRYKDRFTRADFEAMLASDGGQQRYQVSDGRIRALYGHSAVTVEYKAVVPPEFLYHGTVAAVLDAIRVEGLTSQARQYVHLSTETKRATDVAHRHGKPVILEIRALAAHEAGLIFYNPEPKHFLVKAVPPNFINFPEP